MRIHFFLINLVSLFLTVNTFAQISICPGSSITLMSPLTGPSYQWQIDSGKGFVNLTPTGNFSGTTSTSLEIINPPASFFNFQFRCVVGMNYSEISVLKFTTLWTGASDINFFNSLNWSCNQLPDLNTDVVIDGKAVQLTANATVRSLTLLNGASITVSPGVSLIIHGKDTVNQNFNFSTEDMDFFDSLTAPIPPQFLARTANTTSDPGSKLSVLIKSMLDEAWTLSAQKTKSPAFTSDTGVVGKPLTYYGLAYSFGSKQKDESKIPASVKADGLHRKYSVYGLDCSGFMIYLLRKYNIPLLDEDNTWTGNFEVNLRNSLIANTEYPTLRIINLGYKDKENLKSGDYILWKVRTHIGIIHDDGKGVKTLLQSNGNPHPLSPNSANRTPYQEQALNWGPKRGVNPKPFDKIILKKPYWDSNFVVLRFAEVFNIKNTAVFTTNSFTSVGVGKSGQIWAGTRNQGLFKFNGISWVKTVGFSTNSINDIKTDRNGGIWIAQSGTGSLNGSTNINGGIHYFPDETDNFTYYGTTAGLPSRNTRSVFIDSTRYNGITTLPAVWSAHMANNNGGTSSSGGLGKGLNSAQPFFNSIRTGIEQTNGLGSMQCLGGNQNEIWAFAPTNFGRSQILIYSSSNGNLINSADYLTAGINYLPINFQAKAIYFDRTERKWLGLSSGSIVAYDNTWHIINLPIVNVLSSTTIVNNNSIAGAKNGEVFIGTNNGLFIYDGKGSIDSFKSYRRLSTTEGLPSNNISAVSIDEDKGRLILATDSGIVVLDY